MMSFLNKAITFLEEKLGNLPAVATSVCCGDSVLVLSAHASLYA